MSAVLVLLLGGGTTAFLVWANDTFPAEEAALAAVREDPRIDLDDRGDVVVMTPADGAGEAGLVFLAGAKVEPQAYAATFQEVVAAGTSVVVVKPFLNLAILERRPLDAFTDLVPGVEAWSVGGHSMGGVRACRYAESDDVDALVLLASYCSMVDLADRDDLTALSVIGTRDGLLATEDVDSSLAIMPPSTEVVAVEGASHAQFGAYGPQPGDDEPTLSDEEARERIAEILVGFLGRLDLADVP